MYCHSRMMSLWIHWILRGIVRCFEIFRDAEYTGKVEWRITKDRLKATHLLVVKLHISCFAYLTWRQTQSSNEIKIWINCLETVLYRFRANESIPHSTNTLQQFVLVPVIPWFSIQYYNVCYAQCGRNVALNYSQDIPQTGIGIQVQTLEIFRVLRKKNISAH